MYQLSFVPRGSREKVKAALFAKERASSAAMTAAPGKRWESGSSGRYAAATRSLVKKAILRSAGIQGGNDL